MSAITKPQRKNKASRITTACNPCRSRKQKCSGKRPNCEQCIDYNRTCEWPDQLKRGPPKGYGEAVEQRLQETEDVLLKVVSQLTHGQLSSILSASNSPPARAKSEEKRARSNPMITSRQRGVEYWQSFPLNDAESIKRWEQDCYRNRSSPSPSQDDRNATEFPKPSKRVSSTGATDVRFVKEQNDMSLQSPNDASILTSEVDPESNSYSSHPPVNSESEGKHERTSDETGSFLAQTSTKHEGGKRSQELSSWKAAPSKKFQEHFLW